MIGVPRDLYYKGIKINALNSIYGTERLIKELSEITGLKINKYIVIDMFALAEAINILGGIDVTLEEDLIDPTYKIKENGQWATLYYKKGSYHLNGVQALRVARSRNFTSDFDRARRQQTVLEAMLEKFKEIGVGSLDKIYELTRTLITYVDTNLTPFELANYFNRFKDFSIHSRNVLDTENILYFTWSNLYLLKDPEKVVDKNFDRGAFILLPVENDWNVIRWYVRELIEG